jgi:hypothetical protein
MRGKTKVMLWFGFLWGLFVLGALFEALVIGRFEIEDWILYGLILLPPTLFALLSRKVAALWLIVVSLVVALGFVCWEILRAAPGNDHTSLMPGLLYPLLIAGITGLLGLAMLFIRVPEGNA